MCKVNKFVFPEIQISSPGKDNVVTKFERKSGIMKKIKDPIVLGFIAGLIGNSAKLAGNLVNRYVFYKSDTTYPEIAGGLFMTKKEREKPTGKVVGGLADFVLGAILGIPLVYMFRYTGKDKSALKGMGYGHFAWIGMYGSIGRLMGINKGVFPLNAQTNMSALFNHTWYGLVTALVINKLGAPSLFPEPRSYTDPIVDPKKAVQSTEEIFEATDQTGHPNNKNKVRRHIVAVPTRKQKRI